MVHMPTYANSLQSAGSATGDPLENYFWYQDVKMAVGVGAGYAPQFSGSDSYRFLAAPFIDLTYKHFLFLSTQRGLGVQFRPIRPVAMGARLLYNFGRDNEGHIKKIKDLPGSLDAGVFLRFILPASFIFNMDAQTALTQGGHKGTYGGMSLAYQYRLGQNWELLPRVGASFANHHYMKAFYGVAESEALASGFEAYNPQGGFKDADIALATTFLGIKNWRLFFTVGAGLLGDIPSESDIVETNLQYRTFVGASYIL